MSRPIVSLLLVCFALFYVSCGDDEATTTADPWTALTSGVTPNLNGVFFTSDTVGYVVGDEGTAIKTTDGGATWTTMTVGTSANLTSVFFVDSDTGFITHSGSTSTSVLKTTDAGANWSALTVNSNQTLYALSFVSTTVGAIGGGNGQLETTANAGTGWTNRTSGTSNSISDIEYLDENTLIYIAGGEGTIGRSTDAGASWSSVTSGTTEPLAAVDFVDTSTGFAAGGQVNTASDDPTQVVLKSTDGGASWSDSTPPTAATGATNFEDVVTLTASTVFVVGSNVILKSTDGGSTWATRQSVDGKSFLAIHFPSSSVGYAVGKDGIIYKTTTGG